jgi:hypothetical protein
MHRRPTRIGSLRSRLRVIMRGARRSGWTPCLQPLDKVIFKNFLKAVNFFCIFFSFFGGLECVGHSFAYVAHFVFFEICLDSNPESCHSKQARYQLSHPSPSVNFATWLYDAYLLVEGKVFFICGWSGRMRIFFFIDPKLVINTVPGTVHQTCSVPPSV